MMSLVDTSSESNNTLPPPTQTYPLLMNTGLPQPPLVFFEDTLKASVPHLLALGQLHDRQMVDTSQECACVCLSVCGGMCTAIYDFLPIVTEVCGL